MPCVMRCRVVHLKFYFFFKFEDLPRTIYICIYLNVLIQKTMEFNREF